MGLSGPDELALADNFSIRWRGTLKAPITGKYIIQTVSDDGTRLWVDDQLLVDEWYGHGTKTFGGTVELTEDDIVNIELEYFEAGGGANCTLQWVRPDGITEVISSDCLSPVGFTAGGVGTGLTATYYSNINCEGDPAVTTVSAVDFNWGLSQEPIPGQTDFFSARYLGALHPRFTGPLTVTVRSDDGVRLWLDGELVVDAWKAQSATSYSATIDATAGQPVTVRLDYYERTGGATVKLFWESANEAKRIIPAEFLTTPAGADMVTVNPTQIVSPAMLEGIRFPGQPVSLTVTDTLGETTTVPVEDLGETGFYAFVDLDPAGPVTVTMTAGDTVETCSLTWVTTPIDGGSLEVISKGRSTI
jgi:hypothetical protein